MKQIQLDDAALSEFFNQLSLLLNSGIRVSDALRILAEGSNSKEYNIFLENLAEEIESGISISDAFEETGMFSFHVIGFLRTSEQTGNIEKTLTSLSNYYDNKDRRKKQLINTLTFPCILLLLMLIIIFVLLTQVMPIFNDIYTSLGGSLSSLAQGLISIGITLNKSLPYIGITLGLILIFTATTFIIPNLRNKIVHIVMNFFGDKGLYRLMNNASFIQALSVAVNSGLTFEEGISLASELFNDNPKAKTRCQKCIELMGNGTSFDEALKECGLLTSSSAYMLKLSMSTGKSDEVILSIADRMAEESDDAINEKLSKIEPALVLSTSLITGVILLTVMMPLIDIMKTIG